MPLAEWLTPERVKNLFFYSQFALGAGIATWLLFFRNSDTPSNFRTREADRVKPKNPGSKGAGPVADPLAHARLTPRKPVGWQEGTSARNAAPPPLSLPGIRIDVPAHEILGVRPDATPEEIQKAYRERMKQYHPDKVAAPGTRPWQDAQAIAEALNRAKEQLMKSRKPLAVLFAFWLLTCGGGAGAAEKAPEGAKTLEDSYQATLKRSETVAIQAQLIDQAEERARQAIGGILPSLNLSANNLWQEPVGSNIGSSIYPSSQGILKFTANQPLFRGFREFAALRLTREQTLAQRQAYRSAASQLYVEVAQVFYNICSLERDRRNVSKQIELYGKRLEELNARIRIGRSRASESLVVESARASLRAQAESLGGQIRAARIVYSLLTGFPEDTELFDDLVSSWTLKLYSLEKYLGGLDFRPDVQAEKSRIEAARQGVTIARGAHWPSIDLSGNYYAVRTAGAAKDVNWDVQLSLTLPLYAGGAIQSKVREAEISLNVEELAFSRIRRIAEQEIRSYFENLQAARRQLRALEEAHRLAEASYQAQNRDYRLGLVTNLDVLNALASFQDAQRALDRARFIAEFDFARLEVAAALRPRGGGS